MREAMLIIMANPLDRDHAGIGGIETSGVLERLDEIVAASATPDIILLGIGGNDLTDGQQPVSTVVENIELIIMELRASYPDVEFLVERIAPASGSFMTAELSDTLDILPRTRKSCCQSIHASVRSCVG